jgi:GH18 family chitinase
VSFDDLDTIKLKVDFLKDQGLGGAMVWALDLDDFKGTFCQSDETYPLLRTINRGLGLLAPAKSSDQILQTLADNEIKRTYSLE